MADYECKQFKRGLLFLLIFSFVLIVSADNTPIVLWHGMGDSCCNPFSLGGFTSYLKEKIPGVYVKSLRIGRNMIEDTENGFFMDVNEQVGLACALIHDDPKLLAGYNAIGFSQGAQFLRAVAQRCPKPAMKTLISLGGQHQGVYGLPHCLYPTHKWCDYVRKVLNKAAYESWVQSRLVQAQYWHDPLDEPLYQRGSYFLAEINNEVVVNRTYVYNLMALENLVLVRFNNDTMVEPIDSEWFGFYKPGQAVDVQPLQESNLYKEDRLGLQVLNKTGRLHFLAVDGDHLQFTEEWFEDHITKQFLLN